ncbi:AzlC family ABC transporter permease [Petroclostridium sp. X23]|jgi:4-azaleucine resistance transporter AzlC|uniref:AzlC family ABC transporter permease n=1 Tax=Petroclostridium sp. X23 TaxID=3045146 RepID=UPI0024AE6181|nr:AzlC family ABC transporter permease [Petroclostridium sp. X23]WHH60303.1 AzlC family ABC transporter permease [Petroclostridium sp. X23]
MNNDYIKGAKGALPIILGYLPIGFAFGVLASQQNLTIIDIFSMSLFVYAGSSQFIAAAMFASGATAMNIILTTFLVNLRHMLMSASLAPYVKHIPSQVQSLISFGITDETYAVSVTKVREEQCSAKYFIGLHAASQTSWIASTVLGGILGNFIPDPTRWGIDFALSAMFIGLLLMQMKSHKDLLVSVCAGGISLLIAIGVEGSWNIIIATLLAATIGVSIDIWNEKLSLSLSE